MGKQTTYKKSLVQAAQLREIDPPDRSQSGFYGRMAPKYRSHLAKRIKQATSQDELENILRDRKLTEPEQDLAIKQFSLLHALTMRPSRSVVFNFDWDNAEHPEDANIARLCILEWIWRMLKNTHRAARLQIDISTAKFLAVPEIWSRSGQPVPLHYHMMLHVPDIGLAWFDANAARIWKQVLRRYRKWGRLHVEQIRDHNELTNYNMKQSEISWVAQRTLLPIDLAKYRGA